MTTQFSRRDLLRSASLIPIAVTAVACSATGGISIPVGITLPPDLQTLVDYANSIIGKVQSEVGSLPAGVGNLITQAQGFISQMSSTTSVAGATPALTSFAGLVNTIVSYFPSTGVFGSIVQAIGTVMPFMLQMAGVVLPLLALRRHPAMAAAAPMTLPQALAVLNSR